jgi:hypothetical protein
MVLAVLNKHVLYYSCVDDGVYSTVLFIANYNLKFTGLTQNLGQL